jgi:hypothetical protein
MRIWFSHVIIATRTPSACIRLIQTFPPREVIVRTRFAVVSLSLLLFAIARPVLSFAENSAQNPHAQQPSAIPDDPERQAAMDKEMVKKANQERQAQLRRDTDHLWRLSSELKQSVDKSNENTLSLEVIKKAEEIEKLARSVKEKMKGN